LLAWRAGRADWTPQAQELSLQHEPKPKEDNVGWEFNYCSSERRKDVDRPSKTMLGEKKKSFSSFYCILARVGEHTGLFSKDFYKNLPGMLKIIQLTVHLLFLNIRP
jgi:hypothetical protein